MANLTRSWVCWGRRPAVGVQLVGQQHEEARMTALARWLLATIEPVVV
ncbi:MAG: hypothetical protein JO055_02275 [Alphaproteobacteria bacterium]|nr:hypothetical protein [Alphaproteobacteria bacterium]